MLLFLLGISNFSGVVLKSWCILKFPCVPSEQVAYVFRSSHWRCSVKKVFLKISQISQENTCVTVSFFIKFTESVTKRSRKKHFPTLKKLLLSELPSFSIELGNYQISLILSRLSAVNLSFFCNSTICLFVVIAHGVFLFPMIAHVICLFCVIAHAMSFFPHRKCCLSFFPDSTCYLLFFPDSTSHLFLFSR